MSTLHFFLFFIFLSPVFLQAQELDSLLSKRNELFQAYQASEASKSSFFGTKSKTDYKNTIETLKEIIEVDNGIMEAIRKMNLSGESTLIEKNALVQKRLFELEKELEKNKAQLVLRTKELSKIQTISTAEDSYRYKYHLAMSIWFATICFWIGKKYYFKKA
jgi:conjugal transfer/entry exclusion protein